MNIDPNTTKYMVKAKINADGIIENPDELDMWLLYEKDKRTKGHCVFLRRIRRINYK